MCIAAAHELAQVAVDRGIHEDYIVPNMDEWEVFPREAVAVGTKAIEQGVARKVMPADERFKMAEETIRAARERVQMLMEKGFIIDPDN
jgi:malate dehydrogenase (oxaloacetate-decarboxylating)